MINNYRVKQIEAGKRIDQVVLDMITNLTRSSAKTLLMEGVIRVNNQQVRPNYKAKENDLISYDTSKIDSFLDRSARYSIKPVKMNIEVLYEDEHTLVVNKPSNLTTHPVPGHREDTLLNGLVYYQTTKSRQKGRSESTESSGKIRPVHRLDKDTSGVILFAKSRDAHVFYSEQFEKNLVEKTYYAVVKGDFRVVLRGKTYKSVQNYLARSSTEKKKMVAVPAHLGQIAISKIFFDRLWNGLNGEYSLVKIMPKTGRTHQIRVHLSGLGHPVLGDTLYSNTHYKRLMLHACSLKIQKFGGEMVEFAAPLPKEFLV